MDHSGVDEGALACADGGALGVDTRAPPYAAFELLGDLLDPVMETGADSPKDALETSSIAASVALES